MAMTVRLQVELNDTQLTALAKLAGKSFLSGSEIASELCGIVKRELDPGTDLGWAYRMTYYREDADHGDRHGFKLFTHVFMGPYWPHVVGRPRMYWDGRSLRTRGGAFTVNASRGIIPTTPPGGSTHARAS